jgi:carboxyl-terminal processing protease
MRAFLLLMLFSGAILRAQSPLSDPSTDDATLPIQLHAVLEQTVTQYHRPLSPETLYLAVCARMYEMANLPVPITLRDEVREALARPRDGRLDNDFRLGLLAQVQKRTLGRRLLLPADPLVATCEALTRELDPYSGLVSLAETKRAAQQDSEMLGIGVEWDERAGRGGWTVQSVALGSPAQRAGLRPGDVLHRVNGQPISRASVALRESLRAQRGERLPVLLGGEEPQEVAPEKPPERLELELTRGTAPARKVTLKAERHRPETVLGTRRIMGNRWSFWLDEKAQLAYLRLTQLSRGTADELRDELRRLQGRGTRGLVLDLRWCPGGYLNEAVEVADLFVGDQVIATVKMRHREDTIYRGNEGSVFGAIPLVVLVNGDTLGGAEMIAAALQDHGRALVVGQRTRGKASIQTPLALGSDQFSFKVTSGTFSRPSGKNLHRHPESGPRDDWGVRPDVDCRLSPDLGRKLRDEWLLWSLRPVDDAERLLLDDPTYDAQKTEALKVLRERLAKGPRAARK